MFSEPTSELVVCSRLTTVQVNYKDSEIVDKERYKAGQPNSHLANDSSTMTIL